MTALTYTPIVHAPLADVAAMLTGAPELRWNGLRWRLNGDVEVDTNYPPNVHDSINRLHAAAVHLDTALYDITWKPHGGNGITLVFVAQEGVQP